MTTIRQDHDGGVTVSDEDIDGERVRERERDEERYHFIIHLFGETIDTGHNQDVYQQAVVGFFCGGDGERIKYRIRHDCKSLINRLNLDCGPHVIRQVNSTVPGCEKVRYMIVQ